MTNLNITHSNVQNSIGVVALFGNQIYGEVPNINQSIQLFWLEQIRRSKYRAGDVSLYVNGKLVRTVLNGNERLLDKDVKFNCEYIKH